MRIPVLAAVLILCFSGTALAATYVVNPDGTGDFPTIQAALAGATNGDVIELTDGVFTGEGNRDIEFLGKAITVRSQSGQATDCIIDCQHLGRGFHFQGLETDQTVLEGVSIINGFITGAYPLGGGGGIRCYRASPIVRDCIVAHCRADWGGGIWSHQSYPPRFIRCTLYGNEATIRGGGFDAYQGAPLLEGCTIVGNTAPRGAGIGGTVSALITVANTIVAFNEGSGSVYCGTGTSMVFTCSDIFGNGWGDWFEWIASQLGVDGNISAHPLFCDPLAADFHLQENSPCAGENHPECDLIGAWPVACAARDYACCLEEECQILSETACANLTGEWLPGEESCDPNPCIPSTYLIKPDGTGDFPTIQAALDAAEAGDTIKLADGTYLGEGNRDLDFQGKALTLRSRSANPSLCIIDCEGSAANQHRGIYFHHYEGPATLVEGIAIVNGYAGVGGGIRCEGSGVAPTLRDLVIANCHSNNQRGAGLLCSGSPGPTVIGCSFRNNTASLHGGGGAACMYGADAQFIDCEFKGNNGPRGGGVNCWDANPTFLRCAFSANHSFEGGGGIWGQEEASPTVLDCSFEANETPGQGGALQCWGGSTVVTGCTFSNNSAGEGGAVYSQLGSTALEIRACKFAENVADGGGAIMLSYAGWTTISACDFRGNSATNGGALRFSGTLNHPIRVEDCTFSANVASGAGGAIHSSQSAALMVGCTIADNDGPVGSGVHTTGEDSDVQLERTLIAFGLQGEAVSVLGDASASLLCCDLFGNEGGDWVGPIADQFGVNGNIAADPIFCRELHPPDPYMLRDDSPCAEENNPECGQIGAWGVGCTAQGSGLFAGPGQPADRWHLQVRPNVTASGVKARFNVPPDGAGAVIRLRVLDPAGRLVRELLDSAVSAGWHEVTWDGSTHGGGPQGVGVFFLRLETPGRVASRRVVILR